jgi:hypothetical protein
MGSWMQAPEWLMGGRRNNTEIGARFLAGHFLSSVRLAEPDLKSKAEPRFSEPSLEHSSEEPAESRRSLVFHGLTRKATDTAERRVSVGQV